MIKILLLTTSIALPSPLWAIETTSITTEYDDLIQHNGQLLGRDKTGTHHALTMVSGKLNKSAVAAPESMLRPEDILSDDLVSSGADHTRQAWLGGATQRYDHGVLADSIEASRLYAQNSKQSAVYLELPPEQVFEDRLVRFADIDGDNAEELIVIRTDTKTGAGIASYALENGDLKLEAASETIGLSHRWLNIVGIADFTGDGKTEIAAVITPHIGGTLILFQQRGTGLVPILKQWGYSNHEYGKRELGMSTVLDINSDGVTDMAVPNETRRELILLTAIGKQFQVLSRVKHTSAIKSGLYSADIDNDSELELVYLLTDKTLLIIDL